MAGTKPSIGCGAAFEVGVAAGAAVGNRSWSTYPATFLAFGCRGAREGAVGVAVFELLTLAVGIAASRLIDKVGCNCVKAMLGAADVDVGNS